MVGHCVTCISENRLACSIDFYLSTAAIPLTWLFPLQGAIFFFSFNPLSARVSVLVEKTLDCTVE